MNLEKELMLTAMKYELESCTDPKRLREIALDCLKLYMLQQETLKAMVSAFGPL